MALVSLADFKAWVGVDSYDTGRDTLLQAVLDSGQAAVERACGRVAGGFEKSSWTEYYDGLGVESVQVANWPLVAVTTLHDDMAAEYGASTLVAAADYSFSAKGLIWLTPSSSSSVFWKKRYFGDGVNNLKIVYEGGYEAADVPELLKTSVKQSASYFLNLAGAVGKTSESAGSHSVTYDKLAQRGVPKEVEAALNEFLDLGF